MSENPSRNDTVGEGYDPEQDPDTDPDMITERHPAGAGENERDPAEGPEYESVTGG